jgi:hypothetical protein
MSRTHEVKQGECLSSIARNYGFADWHSLYDHAQNSSLREKRPNPNILHPGDLIFIPDKQSKHESCPTERSHRFKVETSRVKLRLMIRDDDGQPLAGKRYVLTVGEREYEGTTGADGMLEHDVSATEKQAELLLWPDEETSEPISWLLEVGHLDPVGEITGVQARLNNLGFDCGPVDGIVGRRTKWALKRFQVDFGLSVTGEPDPATRTKLEQLHDGV